MANGRPGDDPVMDIIVHGIGVFSPEIDEMIRQLNKLMDWRRLQEFIELVRRQPPDELRKSISDKLQSLRDEARTRGWEVE